MSEQKGVFVLMGLFLLFCRCPVCFLVSRLDSFVFVSLFDSFVIIALFDSFNVIARLDRAIQIEGAPVKPHPAGEGGRGGGRRKMMLCGMDYPVKPDNDRERECRIKTVRKLNRMMTERQNGRMMT